MVLHSAHASLELLPGARGYIAFTSNPGQRQDWHVLCRFSKIGWLTFLDDDTMAVAVALEKDELFITDGPPPST